MGGMTDYRGCPICGEPMYRHLPDRADAVEAARTLLDRLGACDEFCIRTPETNNERDRPAC